MFCVFHAYSIRRAVRMSAERDENNKLADDMLQVNVLSSFSVYFYDPLTRSHVFLLSPQTHLPNIKVHAYFAPVTPPPSVGGSRQRFCRCCVLL